MLPRQLNEIPIPARDIQQSPTCWKELQVKSQNSPLSDRFDTHIAHEIVFQRTR
jgi:hypothetical protein